MTITKLHYTLDSRRRVNWSAAQENSISTDYPFELHAEPLEQCVARTYLQFLWLPQVSLFFPPVSQVPKRKETDCLQMISPLCHYISWYLHYNASILHHHPTGLHIKCTRFWLRYCLQHARLPINIILSYPKF